MSSREQGRCNCHTCKSKCGFFATGSDFLASNKCFSYIYHTIVVCVKGEWFELVSRIRYCRNVEVWFKYWNWRFEGIKSAKHIRDQTRPDTWTGISRVGLGRGSNVVGRGGKGYHICDSIISVWLGRSGDAKTARKTPKMPKKRDRQTDGWTDRMTNQRGDLLSCVHATKKLKCHDLTGFGR